MRLLSDPSIHEYIAIHIDKYSQIISMIAAVTVLNTRVFGHVGQGPLRFQTWNFTVICSFIWAFQWCKRLVNTSHSFWAMAVQSSRAFCAVASRLLHIETCNYCQIVRLITSFPAVFAEFKSVHYWLRYGHLKFLHSFCHYHVSDLRTDLKFKQFVRSMARHAAVNQILNWVSRF